MEPLLFIPLILSFFACLLTLPYWIRKTKYIGLLWEDLNKFGHPKRVAASGGIVVVMSFTLGVLLYIAIRTFFTGGNGKSLEILALLSVILILAIVGLTDDLLGWRHGGLSARVRLFLAFMAAIPLVVINAGEHLMSIPFIGLVNLGFAYPLIIIPLGIAGATTTYNMLAGYNGLETGQGILILSALSIVAFLTGNSWLSLVGLCMVVALAAFLIFNKFPAKVFPGDILTYSIGALIACMAILGNFEKIAIFFFIPYILEVFLKLRGKLKKQSFAKPNKDNSLEMLYKKIYGLEHIALWFLKKIKKNGKVYEKEVVYALWIFQIIIIILGFIIFKESIF